jgi:hypothetical protein
MRYQQGEVPSAAMGAKGRGAAAATRTKQRR